MKKAFISMFVLALTLSALPVAAATFGSGEQYSLSTGEILEDNLYAAGASININDPINGDAFVAGANLTIAGQIAEDLTVAGANVFVNAPVGGDMRAVGSSVYVNNDVAGEAMLAGAYVVLAEQATVHNGLYSGAAKLAILGNVIGDLKASADEVEISGYIQGDVEITAERLVINKNAEISGNLVYKSPEVAVIAEGAIIGGEIIYEEIESVGYQKKEAWAGILAAAFLGFFLLKLLMSLVLGLVLFFIFRKKLNTMVRHSMDNFWMELIRGFVVMIVVPIVAIILLVSVLGLPLGILLGLFYASLLILASPFAGILFGYLIWKLFKGKGSKPELTWPMVVVGILLFHVIKLIPVIGWIACIFLFLVSLGVLSLYSYRHELKFRD